MRIKVRDRQKGDRQSKSEIVQNNKSWSLAECVYGESHKAARLKLLI